MDAQTLHNVLIVEENNETREMIRQCLSRYYLNLDEVSDGSAAISQISRKVYDLALLDMELPGGTGMEVLAHLRSHARSTPVITLTASRDIGLALTSMKQGAYDFLTKPFIEDELAFAALRALDFRFLRNHAEILERSQKNGDSFEYAVGNSDSWLHALETARRFAGTDQLVCIEGERGTGKCVVANYIHTHSRRKEHPFITLDCGIIPAHVVEFELFGYEKGVVAGTDHPMDGLVELANRGTLFLDGICDVQEDLQRKLAVFVETKTFRRLGDAEQRKVDVRIIAATNKNLEEESKSGKFRADLWYHLNVQKLLLPPLRERPEDVQVLARHFLTRFCHHNDVKSLSPEAAAFLESYTWPGNVRELQSAIQRAILVSKSATIEIEDLNIEIPPFSPSLAKNKAASLLRPLHAVEKRHIESVLSSVQGNISMAAKILEISRTTLYARLKENGIDVSRS